MLGQENERWLSKSEEKRLMLSEGERQVQIDQQIAAHERSVEKKVREYYMAQVRDGTETLEEGLAKYRRLMAARRAAQPVWDAVWQIKHKHAQGVDETGKLVCSGCDAIRGLETLCKLAEGKDHVT